MKLFLFWSHRIFFCVILKTKKSEICRETPELWSVTYTHTYIQSDMAFFFCVCGYKLSYINYLVDLILVEYFLLKYIRYGRLNMIMVGTPMIASSRRCYGYLVVFNHV
jgi:hypothetical protein